MKLLFASLLLLITELAAAGADDVPDTQRFAELIRQTHCDIKVTAVNKRSLSNEQRAFAYEGELMCPTGDSSGSYSSLEFHGTSYEHVLNVVEQYIESIVLINEATGFIPGKK